MPATQENRKTITLSGNYWRQLVEAGMPAQGNEAEATARAIARWDSEYIPLTPLQQGLVKIWRSQITAAGLWRMELDGYNNMGAAT